MPTAAVNGQTIYYEVHGEGEPLLCVMGLAADTLSWALNVPGFAERHQTIVFDNRDVGQSSMADAPYELSDMATDRSHSRTSWSSTRSTCSASRWAAPSRSRSRSPRPSASARSHSRSPTPAGAPTAASWPRVWSARRQAISHEQHIDELMLQILSEELYENADFIAYVRQMMLSNPHPQPPDAFARQIEAASHHDGRELLPGLSMPVHVIGAAHDILVPVWKSQEIAGLIPGAKLSVVPAAPHGVQLERAEEFNRLVLDFIAEQAAVTAD